MTRPRAAALVMVAALLAACSTTGVLETARRHAAEGRGEDALALLAAASRDHPRDTALRSEYFRLREVLLAQWLTHAEALRSAGQAEPAEGLYRRVLAQDPGHARASAGLAQLDAERRHRATLAEAEALARVGRYLEAQERLQPVLAASPPLREARRLQRTLEARLAPPVSVAPPLRAATSKPVSIELREVTLRNVFEVLSRATGIGFLFDRDVRTESRTSIALREAAAEEALRLALLANQLEHKVINETTVFVYPNTPQKQREYQELVVKGFYLANADVKQAAAMIRTMVRTRDVFVDERIGLLVIKDTPGAVRLAERLIAAQDLAEPEVMLEVEVLEIARSRLQELGVRFPSSLAVSLVGAAGTPGVVTLPEWLNRSSDIVRLSFSDPLFLLSLRQQDGTSSVLANPRIRVKNRDRARIHIGDRVPVITTTAAASGGFVSESVSYLDVGLKLEVEPLIFLDDEVGIKVGLEVSNIVREVRGLAASGTLAYQIGTRNASTNLRLRDGETQVLAGLISDDERRLADRVPGLGELPVAGRLFSHTRDSAARTEIVLLITPRLLRTLERPEAGALEFAAGTEGTAGALRPPSPTEAPLSVPLAPPAPPAGAPPAPLIVPFGGVK